MEERGGEEGERRDEGEVERGVREKGEGERGRGEGCVERMDMGTSVEQPGVVLAGSWTSL